MDEKSKVEFSTDRLNKIINTLAGMGIIGKTDIDLIHEAQSEMIKLDEFIESRENLLEDFLSTVISEAKDAKTVEELKERVLEIYSKDE